MRLVRVTATTLSLSLTGSPWSSNQWMSNLPIASVSAKDGFLEHIPLRSPYRFL
ncbi:MAG TPA: hypothetical protein V6D14_06965 [Coleofasciculaceae cyanobacterium]